MPGIPLWPDPLHRAVHAEGVPGRLEDEADPAPAGPAPVGGPARPDRRNGEGGAEECPCADARECSYSGTAGCLLKTENQAKNRDEN